MCIRDRSMPVLSVPGGDHAVHPTAAFRRPCPPLFFGAFALTALHQLTWRIRAGTVARLHTSHHADAPESCHVPDRGSVPRRPLCRSRQPAVGQAAQHSSDERAVPVSYTHLTLPTILR